MTGCRGTVVYEDHCVGHVSFEELTGYVGRLDPDAGLDARGALIDKPRYRQLT